MKPGRSFRSRIGAGSGGVWASAILAGLLSGGGQLGAIIVALQHAPGSAGPRAPSRPRPARTVVTPANGASPW